MPLKPTSSAAISLVVLCTGMMSGCASMFEGITRAVMGGDEVEKDTRACHIRGPAFEGIAGLMARQDPTTPLTSQSQELKVLMVHGIGTHHPGYSARLQENLARLLELPVVSDRPREILIRQPLLFPDEELGVVRVNRYTNAAQTKAMLFYEMTWSGITEPDKRTIAYDNSGEYSFRRTEINEIMKQFINTHIPDPLIYLGNAREKIQVAVAQTICWTIAYEWDQLALRTESICPNEDLTAEKLQQDDHVFISHSLGSRIVIDALQRIAEKTAEESKDARIESMRPNSSFLKAMREEDFSVFMFANQLSLLQLGREPPAVANQIADYCSENGEMRDQRFLQRLNIVAFSDPNDIMSWVVPPDYAHKHMDSRLCPIMNNVNINIAKVVSVLGAAEVANPAVAHSEYDNDDRVMALVAGGIGSSATLPIIEERCEWLETR